jgi:hypothetical protein
LNSGAKPAGIFIGAGARSNPMKFGCPGRGFAGSVATPPGTGAPPCLAPPCAGAREHEDSNASQPRVAV